MNTAPTLIFPGTSISTAMDHTHKFSAQEPLNDTLLLYILTEEALTLDLTFVCKDGQVPAHRLILAAASKFIAQLLTNHESWDPATIILPDVTVEVMDAVRNLCYMGVTEFPPRIEGDVHKVLQMLLIGDKANLMTSLIQPPASESSYNEESQKEADAVVPDSDLSGNVPVYVDVDKDYISELLARTRSPIYKLANDDTVMQTSDNEVQGNAIVDNAKLQRFGEASTFLATVPTYPGNSTAQNGNSSLETTNPGILTMQNGNSSLETTDPGILTPQTTDPGILTPQTTDPGILTTQNENSSLETTNSKKPVNEDKEKTGRRPGLRIRKKDSISLAIKGRKKQTDKPQRSNRRRQRTPTKQDKDKEDEAKQPRRMTRQGALQEKRGSVDSTSSGEDIFMPVKIRKRDYKFLLTPTKIEAASKTRASLDFGQINKLYKSLGQLTGNSREATPGPPTDPPKTKTHSPSGLTTLHSKRST